MYSVPFGKGHLKFDLPPNMKGSLVDSKRSNPLKDVKKDAEEALNHPINTKPLVELAGPGDNVCVVFTDITRSTPDHILVPAILNQLKTAGVHDVNITLLCGIGMLGRARRRKRSRSWEKRWWIVIGYWTASRKIRLR